MIKFEKVSLDEFMKQCNKVKFDGLDVPKTVEYDTYGYRNVCYNAEEVEEFFRKCYDEIKLPKRATKGSAGYDFYLPVGLLRRQTTTLDGTSKQLPVVIPTGIRCKMDNDVVLMLYPRSGLGFKHGMGLSNTVGVIDSDYYYSDNEGHIMAKLVNNPELEKGSAFMQGIFVKYLTTDDDEVTAERNGGFGSTDNYE